MPDMTSVFSVTKDTRTSSTRTLGEKKSTAKIMALMALLAKQNYTSQIYYFQK